jgi:hypothetical protein
MAEEKYEPQIDSGFYRISFYGYSATFEDCMTAALEWLKMHPEYSVEDILVGSDEGTWLSLYCKMR